MIPVYFCFLLEYGDILMKNDFVGIFIFMLSGLYMTKKNKVTVASVIFYHFGPVVLIKNVTRRRLSFFSGQNSQTIITNLTDLLETHESVHFNINETRVVF